MNTRARSIARRCLHGLLAVASGLLAVVLLLAASLAWWATQPEALPQALAWLERTSGVDIEVVDAAGTLAGPFTIGRLVVHHPRAELTLVDIRGELRLAALLHGTLGVRRLAVDTAEVIVYPTTTPATPGFLPAWLRIGWDALSVRRLHVTTSGSPLAIDDLASAGSLTRWTLQSEALSFRRDDWTTRGRFRLAAPPSSELHWAGTVTGPVLPSGPPWTVAATLTGRVAADGANSSWAFTADSRRPAGLEVRGEFRLPPEGWQVIGTARANRLDLAPWGIPAVPGATGGWTGLLQGRADAAGWQASRLQMDLPGFGALELHGRGAFGADMRSVELAGRWRLPDVGAPSLAATVRWPGTAAPRWQLAVRGRALDWHGFHRLPALAAVAIAPDRGPARVDLQLQANGSGFAFPTARSGTWELQQLRIEGEGSHLEAQARWQAGIDWQARFRTTRLADWVPGYPGEMEVAAAGKGFTSRAGQLELSARATAPAPPNGATGLAEAALELRADRTDDGMAGELSALRLRLHGAPGAFANLRQRASATWRWQTGRKLAGSQADWSGLCVEPDGEVRFAWQACTDARWVPAVAGQPALLALEGRMQAPRGLQLHLAANARPAADRSWRQWPLTGTVDGNLPALDFLPLLVADIDRVAGKVSAALTLAGTVGEPDYRGALTLTGGELDFVPANLRLREATATLGLAPGSLTLTGEAKAGEGRLKVNGEMQFGSAPGLTGQLQLQGERLLLADVPEARLLASPDLKLKLGSDGLHAEGVVRIPEAKLAPLDLAGVVLPSPDERIAGTRVSAASTLPVSARIQLRLGDAVRLETMGLAGNLRGQLTATLATSGRTTAQGELSLGDAKFKAYTRELDIERGRLLFGGGLVSDPGLDLRASRQFPGVKAGVLVRGTLRRPLVRFFSDPSRSQSEVASLLLVGRSIEGLQGTGGLSQGLGAGASSTRDSMLQQGGALVAAQLGKYVGLDEVQLERDANDAASLVLGKYLSPRLYVSYGVGLTEALNTLKLRYTLGHRWVIRTEAGSRQSIDLEYSTAR